MKPDHIAITIARGATTMNNYLIRLAAKTGLVWDILRKTFHIFSQINGAQSAGAFAHFAFFSLFPLIILFVSITSVFVDRNSAETAVIAYVETYVPISGDMQSYIFDTIEGVVKARGQASTLAFLILVWSAMQFFETLISATNRAWGVRPYAWWHLPFKSLFFLVIMVSTVLLGVGIPVVVNMTRNWAFPMNDFSPLVYVLESMFIPFGVVFFSLSLFYRLAPRRPMRFTDVWAAALVSTVLLNAVERLFVIYLQRFATLNTVYGTFGGIIALLMWIYLCGCIFIFGACLSAAQSCSVSNHK